MSALLEQAARNSARRALLQPTHGFRCGACWSVTRCRAIWRGQLRCDTCLAPIADEVAVKPQRPA